MTSSDRQSLLTTIRETHITIERKLQQMASTTALATCAGCTNVCCREEICQESLEAPFLKFILGDKASEYDQEQGWFQPGAGCQTGHGRPLVCYEYFCNAFDSIRAVDNVKAASKAFGQCYNKASGQRHILEIDSLEEISTSTLVSILKKLSQLLASLNEDNKNPTTDSSD